MVQRNFSSQMHVVQNLSYPNRLEAGYYEIVEFEVEEWASNSVHVKRVRKPVNLSKCAYHESFVIGPRGAIKTIYSSFY